MSTLTNRASRRRAARRRVGGLAGMSLVATSGLFGAYLGNPRLPRAYAVPPILACLVNDAGDTLPDGSGTYDPDTQSAEGDFRYCLGNTSAGGTIAFAPVTDGVAIVLDADLAVRTSTVTITGNGPGQTTIDGAGYHGLAVAGFFEEAREDPNPVITLSGMTLTNFTSHDNSEFYNGYSGTTRGGALWAYYADAVVTDVSFAGNTTYYDSEYEAYYGYGGAVAVTGGSLEVTDSTFSTNRAAFGGAIYQHTTATLSITGSTFTGNEATASVYPGYPWGGGAVLALGAASITDSTFTGNSAAGKGGAVNASTYGDNPLPTLTISGSTFTSNDGYEGAGAVYAQGDLSVDYSTFSGNTASGSEAEGGAVGVGAGSEALIQRSTFTGNGADSKGGALSSGSSSTTVRNSTFTSNSAPYGGALHLSGGALEFVTVTDNTASGVGGGAYADAGDLEVSNSIIWGNTHDSDADGSDVYAQEASSFVAGFSAFTSATSIFPFPDSIPGVIFEDPLLGGLASNGGPTQTMLPAASSPVVGAADPSGAPATDQRGYARTTSGEADMGAVESRGERPAPDLSQVPPSWFQASQRGSSAASCPDGSDPSWAEWPNDGTGGWTCEKTTWWDVNKGTNGGWVTTPGFRSMGKGRTVLHFRHRLVDRRT